MERQSERVRGGGATSNAPMTSTSGPVAPAQRARRAGPLVRRPGAVGRPGSSVDVASAQRLYRALQADAGVTPLEVGWISTHSTAKELREKYKLLH